MNNLIPEYNSRELLGGIRLFLYEKKIGYLSRYQNGERQGGAGFIKILREKDACILDIHIQSNLKMLNGNYTLLLLLDSQETAWEQISLREGKGNIHRKIMLRNKMLCIGDILYNEETLWGIKLFLDGQSWISGNFKEKRKELTAAAASEKEEAPDKTEAGQNEKIIQGCQQPIQFRSCPHAKEKTAQNDVRHAGDSRLQSKAGMEDNNVRYEEIKEKQVKIGHPVFEDKWQQLQHNYQTVHPFDDQRIFLSIEPKDFVILQAPFQKLVNNSFLLHGFYNYRHLILGPDKELGGEGRISFYLGVPGTYFDREKMVAVMFGFEGFECAGAVETGKFGYYMRRVEL